MCSFSSKSLCPDKSFYLSHFSGPVIDCKVVGKIKGGFAKINESFHGGRVVFKCNADHVMEGKPGTLCKSGKWARDPPKCHGMCNNIYIYIYIYIQSFQKRLFFIKL